VGWGFSPSTTVRLNVVASLNVAIPFRVGWGFSLIRESYWDGEGAYRRNPFQGGMGFFTKSGI